MKWVPIFNFEKYEISEFGEVRNQKGLILKPRLDNREYEQIRIYSNGSKYSRRIGKLVWESFNNCKCKQSIDHIDRDKSNNHISNLRCISNSHNSRNRDNYRRGNKYKLSPELKAEILRKYKNKEISQTEIMRQFGIPVNYFSVVYKRGTWEKYLNDRERIS